MNAEFVKFDDICAKNYSLAEYNFLFFNIIVLNNYRKYHLLSKRDFYNDFKKNEENNYWVSLISFDDTEFVLLKSLNENQSHYKGESLYTLIEEEKKSSPEKFDFSYERKEDAVYYKDGSYLMLSAETISQLLLLNENGTHSGDFYLDIENNCLILNVIVSSNDEKNFKVKYKIGNNFNELNEFERNIDILFKGYRKFGFKYCMCLSEKNNNQDYREGYFSEIEIWLKEKSAIIHNIKQEFQ